MVLNARSVNGVLTPGRGPTAPSLELSLYRGQAVDLGLQAGEGVGGEIVLDISSWHSARAYQYSRCLKTADNAAVSE